MQLDPDDDVKLTPSGLRFEAISAVPLFHLACKISRQTGAVLLAQQRGERLVRQGQRAIGAQQRKGACEARRTRLTTIVGNL